MMTLIHDLNSSGNGETCRDSDSIPDLLSFRIELQPGSYHAFFVPDHGSLPRLMLMAELTLHKQVSC